MSRWDGDERGHGVANAAALAPGLQELMAAMAEPDWVAEEPEAHLVPQLRRDNGPLAFESAAVDAGGVLVVELRWIGEGDRRALTQAVWALLGEVAESTSYVRGPGDDGEAVWEVVTGMLARDTDFAPHGHTLRLQVADAT